MLSRFFLLFLNPKTAVFAWGVVLITACMTYGVWSWMTIAANSREVAATALRTEVDQLKATNDALVSDQESYKRRSEEIASRVERLNREMRQSVDRRERDFEAMTGPRSTPGEKPDTMALQDRANAGMKAVFDDLEAISR